MSRGFKLTISGIFLIISLLVAFSGLVGLGFSGLTPFSISHALDFKMGPDSAGNLLLLFWSGPITLTLYLIHLKNNKNLFFWLSLIPASIWFCVMFLPYLI